MILLLLYYKTSNAQNLGILQPDSVRQAKIGMPVPYFKVMAVDGKNLLMFEPSDLCGKVTILEIFSTESQSLPKTIKHHELLKQQFKENLQVIFLTEESLFEITTYVEKHPSKLYLAMDAEKTLHKIFPHATKPHTILIDADGYVRAITYPEDVNESVITQLLNNQPINLRLKSELTAGQDVNFDKHTVAEPIYKSILTAYDHNKKVEYEWASQSEFYFNNFSIPALYQSLYQFSDVRTIIESPRAEIYRKDHNSFVCFEMKVPNLSKQSIIRESVAQLNKALPLKSKIDFRTRTGYALVRDENSDIFRNVSNENFNLQNEFIGSQLKYNGLTIRTLKDFTAILEMYGLVNRPIANDTGLPSDLPVSIDALPAAPALLNEALQKYGLKLIEKVFTTEYLILFEDNEIQTTMK